MFPMIYNLFGFAKVQILPLFCYGHYDVICYYLAFKLAYFVEHNTQFCRIIIKFREDKRNNVFREILKCFRKTAKFEFFAKQIIYLESPDHPLQNDI